MSGGRNNTIISAAMEIIPHAAITFKTFLLVSGTSDDASGTSSTSDEGDVTNKHVQKKAANQKCPPKLNIDKEGRYCFL